MKRGDIYRNNETNHLVYILDAYAFDIENATKDIVIFRRYNNTQSKTSTIKRYTCKQEYFKNNYSKLTRNQFKQLNGERVHRVQRTKLKAS